MQSTASSITGRRSVNIARRSGRHASRTRVRTVLYTHVVVVVAAAAAYVPCAHVYCVCDCACCNTYESTEHVHVRPRPLGPDPVLPRRPLRPRRLVYENEHGIARVYHPSAGGKNRDVYMIIGAAIQCTVLRNVSVGGPDDFQVLNLNYGSTTALQTQ